MSVNPPQTSHQENGDILAYEAPRLIEYGPVEVLTQQFTA